MKKIISISLPLLLATSAFAQAPYNLRAMYVYPQAPVSDKVESDKSSYVFIDGAASMSLYHSSASYSKNYQMGANTAIGYMFHLTTGNYVGMSLGFNYLGNNTVTSTQGIANANNFAAPLKIKYQYVTQSGLGLGVNGGAAYMFTTQSASIGSTPSFSSRFIGIVGAEISQQIVGGLNAVLTYDHYFGSGSAYTSRHGVPTQDVIALGVRYAF